MGRQFVAIWILWLTLLIVWLLAECGATISPEANRTPISPIPSGNVWDFIRHARTAYRDAQYDQAENSTRQAIVLAPDNNSASEIYQQTIVMKAAEEHLSALPTHRDCPPVEAFIRDGVNHTRDWFTTDVRGLDAYAASHIEGALNIPLRELMKHMDELPTNKSALIYILLLPETRHLPPHYPTRIGLHQGIQPRRRSRLLSKVAEDSSPSYLCPTPTPESDEPNLSC